MTALTKADRIAGKAKMEGTITPVARARRRFKAGRPMKALDVRITPAEAIRRAVVEYARLQDLVLEEKDGKDFHVGDTRAGLVYVTPEGKTQTFWLPSSWENQPKSYLDLVNELSGSVFLGVVFHQFDRDAVKTESRHTFWVLQFVAGQAADEHLRDERDKARLVCELS